MLSLIVLALATTAPAHAADLKPEKPKKEAKICRMTEADTGSRMGSRRRCRTAAEWASDEDRVGRDLGRGVKSTN